MLRNFLFRCREKGREKKDTDKKKKTKDENFQMKHGSRQTLAGSPGLGKLALIPGLMNSTNPLTKMQER